MQPTDKKPWFVLIYLQKEHCIRFKYTFLILYFSVTDDNWMICPDAVSTVSCWPAFAIFVP